MGTRGRIPDTKKIIELPKVTEIKAPRYLSQRAKLKHNEIGQLFIEQGILVETDLTAWGALWLAWDAALQAWESMKKNGLVAVDEKGLLRKSPAWQIFRDAITTYSKLANDFALTPASRARLRITGKIDDSEMTALERLLD